MKYSFQQSMKLPPTGQDVVVISIAVNLMYISMQLATPVSTVVHFIGQF